MRFPGDAADRSEYRQAAGTVAQGVRTKNDKRPPGWLALRMRVSCERDGCYGCAGNLLDWFLGVPRRPLRHPSRRRQRRVLDAPRRTFGDRPLIGRQRLRHALALLRSLVLRPCGPRPELIPLRELLPLAHGVPLRINRCIMPYPRLWVQRGSGALGRCGLVFWGGLGGPGHRLGQ
jgi:hypothetical protein